MTTAHINIGSNLGDRAALIGRAVAAISERLSVTAVSTPVESAPWGFESALPFLNVGLNVEVGPDMPPARLLAELLDIQRTIDPAPHRNADGSYTDRAIDIDLICYGSLVINPDSPDRLTLPHPRMHLRDFVLRPMTEILPTWRHPLLALTPSQLLGRLASQSPH